MLCVNNLDVFTKSNNQILKNISFTLEDNKVLCILGQSGSGKSVLAYSIMDILHKNLILQNGSIILDDTDLTSLTPLQHRKRLGKDISLIMQNPLTALDPTVRIGKQIAESIKIHNKSITKNDLIERVYTLLKEVNLEVDVYFKYPHEISGGMAQKAVIAIAIANNPKLIIADEPITALDKKSTYDILNILKAEKQKNNSSMIYISHDIESVSFMADIILVLYKGVVVEILSNNEFDNPFHPYTKDLIASVIKGTYKDDKIEMRPKSKEKADNGCIYYQYCNKKSDDCKNEIPLIQENGRYYRCIHK